MNSLVLVIVVFTALGLFLYNKKDKKEKLSTTGATLKYIDSNSSEKNKKLAIIFGVIVAVIVIIAIIAIIVLYKKK